jgi:hypothetical protein
MFQPLIADKVDHAQGKALGRRRRRYVLVATQVVWCSIHQALPRKGKERNVE